ncbi:hypothetical protein GCM10023340_18500 [Nocardioides marinquilinus]|uniref:Phytochrome chromophore attachment site domain-containing protein n=1 Tax=Nocardioides marinquilinus TaxID=1210400 RepID=A0ABP9PHW6_9ACTN
MTRPPAAEHTPAYDVATLTTCDTEPIHVPGAIQPHGVLLALDDDLRLVTCSANCGPMLGTAADEALGRTLAEVAGDDVATAVGRRVEDGYPGDPLTLTPRGLTGAALDGREVDVRVHRSDARIVVELEEQVRSEGTEVGYASARTAMSRLARSATLEDLTYLLAREVRELTAFDRVMVYRFDEQWNGVVVGEAMRDDLNSWLGLHYPASDIPAQARRLYALNPIRLIVDVAYEPVPLHPLFDPGTERPLDMSHAGLRSVSPIHLEYLTNMGVNASMSISIVIDDVLWGLIACHHYSGPHRPSHEARAASEFVTQVASHLIASRARADARDAAVITQAAVAAMCGRIAAAPGDPLDALVADPAILAVVGASGLALNFDGSVRTLGEVPDERLLPAIAAATDDPEMYATSTAYLSRDDARFSEVADVASGVLRIGSQPDRWLMWFRPEQRRVVNWGGDPRNKLLAATEGAAVRLSPRRSFEKWQEITEGQSQPWRPWELDAADELGRQMNALLLLRSREQIAMAESMQRQVVLDRAPVYADVEVVARYRPASTYQLGGDWWDAFELPGRRMAVVVGDVAGHGVTAASAMTQLRTALRAYLHEGHTPAEALDLLDRLMDGLLEVGVATAAVAVIDIAAGAAEIASAGHPAPMMVDTDGHASGVEVARRPLLGVGVGGAPLTRVELPPGAMLVLYTDGLVERRGADLELRTARLHEVAARRPEDVDAEAWADRLIGAFESDDDDTTLLAVSLRAGRV